MPIPVGEVTAIFRYPVKSMRGETLVDAELGWHGVQGDRRLALRRVNDRSGFPWLTASRLPALIAFQPQRLHGAGAHELPSHVLTPEGESLEVFGESLAAEVSRRFGAPVDMVHLRGGIFDDSAVSIITAATVAEIGRLSSQPPDVRRFRPNVVIRTPQGTPFEEDTWVGGTLTIGTAAAAAAVSVTTWDVRCSMVNLHPDSAESSAEVLKAIVRERDTKAGVYGTVTRIGPVAVGDMVYFEASVTR
jgi:uncharacterized protein